MRRLPTLPIVLAGFAAFLDLYATQPLLPLLARTFHASSFAVSLTITAPTVAVALAAAVWLPDAADRSGATTRNHETSADADFFRGFAGSWRPLFRNRQLVATYAIGSCVLFTQVATFTYVTFHLAAPPFSLGT